MLFKRIISVATAAVILSATFTMQAIGGHGEKSAGLKTGYNTRNESAVAGLFFQYRVNRLIRVAPDVAYIFRHNHTDALAINLNVHMPLNVIPTGRVSFYPLAGINYTAWTLHPAPVTTPLTDGNDDVSNRVTKFGFNVGGGFEIYATKALKLYVEAVYTGVRNYSSGNISVGIGYNF